jgi:hypothetical protein
MKPASELVEADVFLLTPHPTNATNATNAARRCVSATRSARR